MSTIDEFGPGSSFHRVMYDNAQLCADSDVKRVILCSGKVYYDLYEERASAAWTMFSSCAWNSFIRSRPAP